jgi:hypothetical protein
VRIVGQSPHPAEIQVQDRVPVAADLASQPSNQGNRLFISWRAYEQRLTGGALHGVSSDVLQIRFGSPGTSWRETSSSAKQVEHSTVAMVDIDIEPMQPAIAGA